VQQSCDLGDEERKRALLDFLSPLAVEEQNGDGSNSTSSTLLLGERAGQAKSPEAATDGKSMEMGHGSFCSG
jgi:hypothetical protein